MNHKQKPVVFKMSTHWYAVYRDHVIERDTWRGAFDAAFRMWNTYIILPHNVTQHPVHLIYPTVR